MTKETDIQNRELEDLFERYREAPDSYVFVMLGDSCRKLGRLEEALAICEEGVEKHPDYASGQVVRGKCLYDLDRQDDARTVFQDVLRIDQNNLVALKFLGMIDAESGDLDSARAHFQRILDLDPDNKEIMHALRVVDEKGRAQEDVHELDAADAVYEAAAPLEADLETSDELASATLADIFASQGYKDKALAIYRELLAQKPDNMAVRARIAALTGEPLELPDEADKADEGAVGEVAEVTGFGDADEGAVGEVAEVTGFGDADEGAVGEVAEVTGFGDADEAPTADVDGDDEMVGETIELADGASAGSDDTPLAIELPGPEWTGDSRAAASTTSDDDLDTEVDTVITTGVDTSDGSDKPIRVPEAGEVDSPAAGGATEQAKGPSVVALPYESGGQSYDVDEGQFEEIEESRPIKRQSPPTRRKTRPGKAKKTKSKVEEPSSQHHRRSINEKENFNYFKRWLDRMQD